MKNEMTTETKEQKPQFAFTDAYRGTYINIIEAKAFKKKGQDKGDPKFGGSFIIEPKYVEKDGKQVIDPASDFGRLQIEVVRMLKAKHPGKKLVIGRRMTQEELDSGNAVEVKVPWAKGETLYAKQEDASKKAEMAKTYAGKFVLKGSSKYRPAIDALEPGTGKLLAFTNSDESVIKTQAAKFFYSGAWFLPTFSLNYYDGDEGKPGGVSLYLNALLFCKHGERLGGRQHNPAEAYKGYIGKISQEDPTAGAEVEELPEDDF
jgi:hypothetical protein